MIGCRVKLTAEKRDVLKAAWRQVRDAQTPIQPATFGGTTIKAITNHSAPSLGNLAGITIADLLGTRESISLITVLNLQAQLKCEVFSEAEILDACKSYVEYVFAKSRDQSDA